MDFFDKIMSNFEVDEQLENDRDSSYESQVEYETVSQDLWSEFEGSEVSETVIQSYIASYINDAQTRKLYGSSPKQLEIIGKFTDELREEDFVETRKNTLYIFEEKP